MLNFLSADSKTSTLDLCQTIANRRKIVASCFYGPLISGYADEKSGVNVLLVLNSYRSLLKTYRKPLAKRDAFILTVDQRAFQKDIKGGWLGEFAAEKLIIPYEPVANSEYLWRQEVNVKRRIIWELLEDIVLEFPELSRELLIKPEYFMYETLTKRAKLFPPIAYRFLNILRSEIKEKNIHSMMKGYKEALKELAKEEWICLSHEQVKITPKLILTIRSRKLKFPVLLRSVQRAALRHIFSVLPKMLSPLKYDEELYMKKHGEIIEIEDMPFKIEDSKKYLFMPTPLGPVPLSDETTIEEFVRKNVPSGEIANIQISEMGGALNTAYLLSFRRNHEEHKIVVKKFKDWFGFKWFPLALWALGTKSFAVLGQSRLEREYALSQFLHSQDWPVPRVLYISLKERLIFKEFVEGESLSKIIQRLLTSKEKPSEEIALIRTVGRKIAEAHRLGVVLGDCKPENVIVTRDGTPYFVDLEQASRNGNQAWDIAEFLYYSGHYASPIAPAEAAELIAKEFVRGYLEAGGKRETIKKAGYARYTKVFSIFTPPHVILAVSNLCKKMGTE